MAAMIGRGRSWLWWLAGLMCALIFGRGAVAGDRAVALYGVRPVNPPVEEPAEKPAASLEDSADWKAILAAWDFAKPLAEGGKSTTAQRKEADEKLKAAKDASTRLAAAGLLAAAEAGLLASEADKLKADIYRNPPTDRMVPCYEAMAIIPAQDSLARLNQRLPFLEALVKDGKIHKGTADKVLATIEADLVTLADEKELAKLAAEKRAEAAKTRDAVKAQVEKLKALLAQAPKE